MSSSRILMLPNTYFFKFLWLHGCFFLHSVAGHSSSCSTLSSDVIRIVSSLVKHRHQGYLPLSKRGVEEICPSVVFECIQLPFVAWIAATFTFHYWCSHPASMLKATLKLNKKFIDINTTFEDFMAYQK